MSGEVKLSRVEREDVVFLIVIQTQNIMKNNGSWPQIQTHRIQQILNSVDMYNSSDAEFTSVCLYEFFFLFDLELQWLVIG